MTMRTTAASLLALALASGGTAAGAQTLEYWVYSDFAQG